MLGHKLWQISSLRFDTFATVRGEFSTLRGYGIFDESRTLTGVEAHNFASVAQALNSTQPNVVVNCIGIVKQDAAAKDPITSISINSLFPHQLAEKCRHLGARLIHLGTDCVFSGAKGNYSEADYADPQDMYGRTKLLGEVGADDCLTIRTSMIGRELRGSHGLVEWFLAQQGKQIKGFTRAIFSGFTTNALARIIANLIERELDLSGVWHVSAEPISKFDLLTLIKQTYGLDIEIAADESFVCDRSLDSSRFADVTGFQRPAWPEMIAEMHNGSTSYNLIRRNKIA